MAFAIPYVFTDLISPINSATTNGNNTYLLNLATTIQPATQVSPTSAANATFGGSYGYTFGPISASQVPLTVTSSASASVATLAVNMGASQSAQGMLISGNTSITGNIFECDLTSGGTKALQLTSAGILVLGPSGGGNAAGDASFSRGASSGAIFIGGSTHNSSLDYGVTTAQITTIDGTFAIVNNSAINSGLYVGQAAADEYSYTGVGYIAVGTRGSNAAAVSWGNAGTGSGSTDMGSMGSTVQTIVGTTFQLNYNGTPVLTVDTSGDLGVLGTLHQSSARKYKTRIEYVDPREALEVALATRIARYDWKGQKPLPNGQQRMASFIADDTPWQLSGGPGRLHADPQKTASYALAALQAVYAELQELKGKLPRT